GADFQECMKEHSQKQHQHQG
nr:RecName: Full=Alpha-basrubrin [Basella alba]